MSKHRRRLDVRSESEINCMECTAACCRAGMGMALSPAERVKHANVLMLKTIVEPTEEVRVVPPLSDQEDSVVVLPGHGVYELREDCTYLMSNNRCGIYFSPDRPEACSIMEEGSIPCLIARAHIGYNDSMPRGVRQIVLDAIKDL